MVNGNQRPIVDSKTRQNKANRYVLEENCTLYGYVLEEKYTFYGYVLEEKW